MLEAVPNKKLGMWGSMSVAAKSADEVVRLGVIGVGIMGSNHARVLADLSGVKVVGIADPGASHRDLLGQIVGCEVCDSAEALLDLGIDAAVIAAPTHLHHDIALTCIKRGVHVLVEKPIASNVEEGRAIVAAAERAGVTLMVGHVERFNPVVAAAREVATKPQFFEIHRLAVFSPRSLDIDVVLDLMIHDLDIVLSLVPAAVREVGAVGIPVLSAKADIANARVEFDDG